MSQPHSSPAELRVAIHAHSRALRQPLLTSPGETCDAPRLPPPLHSLSTPPRPPLPPANEDLDSPRFDVEPASVDGLSIEEKGGLQPPPAASSISALHPSQVYAAYCASTSILTSLLTSAWSYFLFVRWGLLLPLYRRVDLPGLRGFAVVELLVIAAYLSVNAYYLGPFLLAFVTPQSDYPSYMLAMVRAAFRLGTVGTWNVLALWLPITRHSIWNYAIGISFDRSAWYHVWVSRIALSILALHGLGLYAWMLWKGTFLQELTAGGLKGKVPTGELAMLGGLLILVTSLECVRRRSWELFIRAHYVGLLLFTVFSLLHDHMVWKVTLAGLALFGVDWLVRLVNWTRPVQVLDMRVLEGGVTRVEWRSPGFNFEPGQFVLVCFPLLSPFEWHPYSLSSSPHHPSIVVHSKRRGEWTTRLEVLARGFEAGKSPRMFVEGPYGALTLPLPLYRHVLLVSGGMGVTPMLSIYHHLHAGHWGIGVEGRGVEMAAVRFVWSVRDARLIDSVWGDIERLHAAAPLSPPALPDPQPRSPTSDAFCPVFHVTSAASARREEEAGERMKWAVASGRPPLASIFAAMKRDMAEAGEEAGDGGEGQERVGGEGRLRCAVLVCGPEALIQRCRRLCIRHSDHRWQTAGGRSVRFDLHEETYQW